MTHDLTDEEVAVLARYLRQKLDDEPRGSICRRHDRNRYRH
jgi:hypothetical protein